MSFTDSFLDFEAIKNWFDGVPTPTMADAEKPVAEGPPEVGSRPETLLRLHLVDGSGSVATVEEDKECVKVEDGSCSIEDDMGKVSLVGESAKSVDIGSQSGGIREAMVRNDENRKTLDLGESGIVTDVNGPEKEVVGEGFEIPKEGDGGSKIDEIMEGTVEKNEVANETMDGNGEKSKDASDEDDDSESSESESESTSSSSSSSSSSCSLSGDEDDDEEEEEEGEEEEEEAGEAEEGEIRDANFRDVFRCDVNAMVVDWSDDDDEDDVFKGPIRSKNESKFLPPVPPVDASLLPHHQILPVGVILSIIGTQVVVEGIEEHSPLSDGSILWITKTKTPLGLVDEIFGPVKSPYYVVRYNSEAEVPDGISVGDPVSFVPEFASHVLANKDVFKKGYDASGANDEEVSDEAEFSDDEKEAEHKRALKALKRGTATTTDPKPRKNKNNKKGPSQPQFSPLPTSAGFAQTLQPVCSNAPPNGAWPNATPFQQPQAPFFNNGFPMNNNMMWGPQNPHQFPPYLMPMPMPMPNGMPFNQHQVNPNQNVPFGQGFAGQNSFNPMPFGVGVQGQPPPLTPNGLPMLQNFSPQQSGVQGSMNPPQQFNMGPQGGRGSGPNWRGRGRFSRGRGRRQ